jgi:hypothetical protein
MDSATLTTLLIASNLALTAAALSACVVWLYASRRQRCYDRVLEMIADEQGDWYIEKVLSMELGRILSYTLAPESDASSTAPDDEDVISDDGTDVSDEDVISDVDATSDVDVASDVDVTSDVGTDVSDEDVISDNFVIEDDEIVIDDNEVINNEEARDD